MHYATSYRIIACHQTYIRMTPCHTSSYTTIRAPHTKIKDPQNKEPLSQYLTCLGIPSLKVKNPKESNHELPDASFVDWVNHSVTPCHATPPLHHIGGLPVHGGPGHVHVCVPFGRPGLCCSAPEERKRQKSGTPPFMSKRQVGHPTLGATHSR